MTGKVARNVVLKTKFLLKTNIAESEAGQGHWVCNETQN